MLSPKQTMNKILLYLVNWKSLQASCDSFLSWIYCILFYYYKIIRFKDTKLTLTWNKSYSQFKCRTTQIELWPFFSAWKMLKQIFLHSFNVTLLDKAKKLQGSALSLHLNLRQKTRPHSALHHRYSLLCCFWLDQLSRFHKRIASYVTRAACHRTQW